ncbi:hypothetical protein COB11_02165 [Candidatus Aerophobetes bacterium]|uniref:Uncharacterized protein n=1 Tax=Aerophobetes bacterium TaxID=2030807 RepID=A0A2A4YKR4_UNCAE|nr:MAG: hypothetical protein COB11_02165 [Candidatus Aerophobetes bacterium]
MSAINPVASQKVEGSQPPAKKAKKKKVPTGVNGQSSIESLGGKDTRVRKAERQSDGAKHVAKKNTNGAMVAKEAGVKSEALTDQEGAALDFLIRECHRLTRPTAAHVANVASQAVSGFFSTLFGGEGMSFEEAKQKEIETVKAQIKQLVTESPEGKTIVGSGKIFLLFSRGLEFHKVILTTLVQDFGKELFSTKEITDPLIASVEKFEANGSIKRHITKMCEGSGHLKVKIVTKLVEKRNFHLLANKVLGIKTS